MLLGAYLDLDWRLWAGLNAKQSAQSHHKTVPVRQTFEVDCGIDIQLNCAMVKLALLVQR